MPQYQYYAVDSRGRKVGGEIGAADPAQAREQLIQQGLAPTQIALAVTLRAQPPQAPHRLDAGEAEEVLSHVAHVGLTAAPLTDGLRAAAAEATNRRVAAALRFLAAEIDRGKPPLEVLGDSTIHMPPHVRGLVAAATRTGRLGPALDELIEHHRAFRVMFWSILGSMAYPLLVLLLAIVILGFFLALVVPQFDKMFTEFELQLPAATESLLHAGRTTTWVFVGPAKWVLLLVSLGAIFMLYLAATGRGGVRTQRLLEMMPLIGPLWSWAGAAGFMHLLASLLEQDVPLPDALRYTADAMSKADLRRAGVWLAEGIERGQSLADLVETSSCLPATAVPILRWGEKAGVLSEAARTLSSLFTDRVNARTMWLRSASPPVVYLFIIVTLGFAITSLFMPLYSLIQGLT